MNVKHFLFKTLRGRLVLSVALVHAVMMSVFIIDLTIKQSSMILANQEENAQSLALTLSSSSAGWIASSDVVGLQEIIDNQKVNSNLIFSIITDDDGLILAHTDKSKKGQYLLDLPSTLQYEIINKTPELVDVVNPVILEGKHVGWVRVGMGQNAAEKKLKKILYNGILYGILAILIGSVIALFMGVKITKRLYVIRKTIDEIRLGNKSVRAQILGADEASDLAFEFNKMLDTISENEQILNKKNIEYASLNEEYLSQNEMLSDLITESELTNQKLKDAQRISQIGHWELYIITNKLIWSDEIYRIFDLEPQAFEATYESFLNNIHPDDREKVNEAYTNSLKTKTPYEIEHRLLLKDGTIKYVLEKCRTEYNLNGHAIRSLGTVQDITERKLLEIKISELNSRYNVAFENNIDGISILDMEGIFIETNQAFEEITGYTRKELIGSKYVYVNDWLNHEKQTEFDKLLFEKGKVENFEIEWRNNKGEYIFGLMTVQFVQINNQQHVLSIIKNISEFKLAEQKAREYEQRFKIAFDSNVDAINIVTLDGTYIEINKGFTELTGYTKEEVVGKHTSEVEVWKNIEDRKILLADLREKGKCENLEALFVSKHGRIIHGLMNATLININNQPHILSVTRDITERKKMEEELFSSHQLLEGVLNTIPAGIFWKDLEFRFLGCNNEIAKSAGLSNPKQIIGRTDFEMAWKEQAEIFRKDDIHIIETGIPKLNIEEPLTTSDGNELTLLTSKVPLLNSIGQISGILGIYIDITERKKLEIEIKKLSTAVEQSANSIVITDITGNITYVNPKFCELTGYSKEEVIGKNPKFLKTGTLSNEYYKNLWEIISSGKTWTGEFHNKTKKGEQYWEISTITPLKNEKGEITNYLAIKENITVQKNIEKKLIESNVKWETTLLTSPDGIVITDMEGIIEFVSDNLVKMYGFDLDEKKSFIGKSAFDFLDAEYHQVILSKLKKLVNNEIQTSSSEFVAIKKDKSKFVVEENVAVLKNASNIPVNLIAVQRDITSRKQAAEKLKESEFKFKNIFNSSSDGILIFGKDLKFLNVNDTLLNLLKYNGNDYVDRYIFDFIAPKYVPIIEKRASLLLKGVPMPPLEIEILDRDKNTIPVEVNSRVINYENQVAVLAILRNISEKRKAEKTILELEKSRIDSIIEAEERERANFAQEIHDGVGPILSIIKLYLQWVNKADSNANKHELFLKIEELVENVNLSLREISNKLSPHVLTNIGISTALNTFVQKVSMATNLEIKFNSNLEQKLSNNIEFMVYRVITECLNNTIKHAKAKSIHIDLNHQNNKLFIRYKDDGIGFDLNQISSKSLSNGMKNIQNRLNSISAKFKIKTNIGEGFEIKMILTV